MPITGLKEKVGVVSVVDLSKQVDKLGALDAQITGILTEANVKTAPLVTERNELADSVLGSDVVTALGKLDNTTIIGKNYVGEISAKRLEREFKKDANKKIAAILGNDKFIEIATVKFGDIDKYLTEAERKKVLDADYSGKRALKIKARK